MFNTGRPYRFPFKPRQIGIALILAAVLCALNIGLRLFTDLIYFHPKKAAEPVARSIVINGFENIANHRIFDKPDTPFDKRIIMLGACQVSSLHWDYTPAGFDPSGRSSLPYLMEKELRKYPPTRNVYVYNLGMEGTGYIEAFYFLLSALEQPNIRLVILSISQEGDNHIPNENRARFPAYSRFLPKMERMLKSYCSQYPDIAELNSYYEYVKNNPWTAAGRSMEDSHEEPGAISKKIESVDPLKNATNSAIAFIEYNRCALEVKSHNRWIAENASGLLDSVKEWLGIRPAHENHEMNLKPEEWYLSNFRPLAFPYGPRKYARFTERDKTALRAMAKLLAKKKIDFWVHNPPDLAVRMSSLVNDKWWEPLNRSLSDLPNVKTIDMSGYPVENGVDTGGRVAPTYYGSLKTAKAFMPFIAKWNEHE